MISILNSAFRLAFIALLIGVSGCAHQTVQSLQANESKANAISTGSDGLEWTILNQSGEPKTGAEKVEYGDVGRSGDLVSFKRRLTTQSAGIKTISQTVEEIHCTQKNYRILSGERLISMTDGSTKRLTFDGALDWKPLSEKSVGRAGMELVSKLCSP